MKDDRIRYEQLPITALKTGWVNFSLNPIFDSSFDYYLFIILILKRFVLGNAGSNFVFFF